LNNHGGKLNNFWGQRRVLGIVGGGGE